MPLNNRSQRSHNTLSQNNTVKWIIGRAGASPPSRATGAIFLYIWIYLTDRVDTYRIVLNVSTCFYFSVYATISLEPHASLTRAPCLLMPCRSSSTPTIPGLQPTIPCASTESTPAAFRLHQQPRYAFSTVNHASL